MNQASRLFFLLFVFMLVLTACRDKSNSTPWATPPPDYSENYKYYPIKDGREWNYETTIVDSTTGKTEVITEKARYNLALQRTDFYRDTLLWSYSYWGNSGNRMGCCIDMVLIDYNQLDCKSDSVLIYQKEDNTKKITIHQYCERSFPTDAPNYAQVKCIKTIQKNLFKQGDYLLLTTYYAYEIGLVLAREEYYNKSGKLIKHETQRLISHKF